MPSRFNVRIPVWAFLPPRNKIEADGHVAVHLDFHGGGFFMGSCLEQAPFCAKIARERGCIVLCPDHSMGPTRQFPAALEDCEDVLSAVLDIERKTEAGKVLHEAINRHHLPRSSNFRQQSGKTAVQEIQVDTSRLSLSGFSSGGNLALNLVLSTKSADEDWPCLIPEDTYPIPVLLFYPQVHQKELPADRPLKRGVPKPGKFAQSLDRNLVPTYLPEEDKDHPRANPGLVDPEFLHPKARIFVVISGKDTLVDQLDKWIEQVEASGRVGKVETFRAENMKHGFVNFPERMLDRESFRMKREAYARMQAFWDKIATESGHPRTQGMKDGAHEPDHT